MALDLRVSWIAVRRKPSGKDSVELTNDRTACAVPLNRVALGLRPWLFAVAAPQLKERNFKKRLRVHAFVASERHALASASGLYEKPGSCFSTDL